MRLFGLTITRQKAGVPALSPANTGDAFARVGSGGWFSIIREPFSGAWQRNREIRNDTVLTYHAVYSCVTLIASDVSKCCIRLVEEDEDGIWNEVDSAAFSPVLRKPNRYQNRIKFYEQWIVSKLLHGNTYVLKERDARGVVVAMYILDPTRTKVLIAPDGGIYYQLSRDNLSGIEDNSIAVPASEIIHDVMVPLFHPLCGVSPLTACGQAAMQGLSIQNSSTKFFENGARPGGVLTAPGTIDDITADRFKKEWEEKFSGNNAGRVAVLGDGLKYESMTVNAVDAQLIDQLKWTATVVCACYHVPAYKVGAGEPPPYQNIEATDRQYYSQCLQKLFECIELCLDEGLGLVDVQGHTYGTEFDLDDLLRMDTATLVESEVKAIGGLKAPNEARKRLNLKPLTGGDSVYLQQQNFSLEALARRDSQADPFASRTAPAPVTPPPAKSMAEDDVDLAAIGQFGAWELKSQLDRLAA